MRAMTLIVAIAGMTLANGAAAQTPTKLDQFDSWSVYSYKADNKVVCYIVSTPTTQKPATVDHGDNFFLVSKRSERKSVFEPQFMAGYKLRVGADVTVSVGDKDFSFFTRDSSAWLDSEAKEAQLIAAMRQGKDMIVKAVSQRGTNTSYNYSLKGVTAALNSAAKCQ